MFICSSLLTLIPLGQYSEMFTQNYNECKTVLNATFIQTQAIQYFHRHFLELLIFIRILILSKNAGIIQ